MTTALKDLRLNEVTSKDGLLWRDGKAIDLPEADDVARFFGFTCAERLVRHLDPSHDPSPPPVMTPREAWLAERKAGIGASESPIVLGLSPWKSTFQLWAEKCGHIREDDFTDNEPAEFGIRLERPIAEAFADRSGREVNMWPAYQLVRDPATPYLFCTPDATQEVPDRDTGIVQIKTASAYKASDWADGPPLMYQVQTQHELAVTGYSWGTLVVLIGGQKLRYFDFERNDRFIEALLPKLAAFWKSVENQTPPDVDGSLVTAKILARLHPDDNGETVELPDESANWLREIEDAKAAIKEAEAIKTANENKVKAAIGDNTFGMLPDGSRFSWKTQTAHHEAKDAYESTYRVLRKLK